MGKIIVCQINELISSVERRFKVVKVDLTTSRLIGEENENSLLTDTPCDTAQRVFDLNQTTFLISLVIICQKCQILLPTPPLNLTSHDVFVSSASSDAKHMSSSQPISGGEEQAEGSPSNLPQDTLPLPEGTGEPTGAAGELQEKEKSKKTKNNKGAKAEAGLGFAASELAPPIDDSEHPGPMLNMKRNSFRQQYVKLPTNLPIRSASCTLL